MDDLFIYDITGRLIKIGDILVSAQRASSSAWLAFHVVAGFKKYKKYWSSEDGLKIKTTKNSYLMNHSGMLIVPKELFKGTKMEKQIDEELAKLAPLAE